VVSAKLKQTLKRAQPSEPQPAVSADVPLPVSAMLQPTLKREPPELQPAVSPETPLPVSVKVQPTFNREPPELQPEVSPETPLPVSVEVQPTLERAEPLEPQPALSADVPLAVSAKLKPTLKRARPSKPQPAVSADVPLPVSAKLQPTLKREPLELQQAVSAELPLRVGSKVRAVCKFGSVKEGTPGVITAVADVRFFWQSLTYLCTFADNIKVRARPKDIEAYNHEHSLEELEQPDLRSIQSRRIALRAEQLLSRQRRTRLPFAGKTKVPNEVSGSKH